MLTLRQLHAAASVCFSSSRLLRYRTQERKLAAVAVTITVCFLFLCLLRSDYFSSDTISDSHPPGVATPVASHIRRPHSTEAQRSSSSPVPIHQGGIPRIIHQTWKTDADIPETFRRWIASWLQLNPDWQYWMWTDSDVRLLIEITFPKYLALFDSYPTQSYRIDAFRYFVLYEYGGLYVDLDMECLRPIDAAFQQTDCILSQEPVEHATFLAPVGVPLVSNALMACRPRHPFFAHVIRGLSSYSGWWSWNDVLRATGPYMLTTAYHSYRRGGWSGGGVADRFPVDVAIPDAFQPSPDASMVDFMRGICQAASRSTQRSDICTRLSGYDFGRNAPNAESYTTHHWTHSWVGRRNDPWGLLNEQLARFNIDELLTSRTSS